MTEPVLSTIKLAAWAKKWLGRDSTRNVSMVFGGHFTCYLVNMAYTLIILRHLSPGDYGVLSILRTVVGVSAGLLTQGLNWAMVRYVSANRGTPAAWSVLRSTFTIEVIYSVIISLCVLLCAPFIASRIFEKPEIVLYIRLSSIGVIGTALFNFRLSAFQAVEDFKLNAGFVVARSVVFLLVVIALALAGWLDLRSVAFLVVVIPLVVFLVSSRGIVTGMIRKADRGMHVINKLLSASGWLLIYTLCLWVVGQVHMLVLSRWYPLDEVGLYGFAYRIYGVFLLALNAINIVLLPKVSRYKDMALLKGLFDNLWKKTGLLALGMVALVPFARFIVIVVAGNPYLGAVLMLQILMLGAACSVLLSPFANALFALNKFHTIAMGGFLYVVWNLIGHALLTYRFGGAGAAMTQVTSTMVLNGYCYFTARYLLRRAAR